MANHIQDVIDILAQLSEDKDLRVAVSESVKGGLIAGSFSAAGGLLLGPVGLLLGAALGGALTFANSYGKFKPVAVVLREMTPIQKKKLYDRIRKAVTNINPEEVIGLALLIMKSPNIRDVAIKELQHYLSSEMNLRCL